MASSSYYYSKYKEKRNAVYSYNDDIKDLRRALSNLTDTMYDEAQAVNKELDILKANLKSSVKHNLTFTSFANGLVEEKEKSVYSDAYLSSVITDLEDEISRLSSLKRSAENSRDYYYQLYKEKKEEERIEFLNNLLQ